MSYTRRDLLTTGLAASAGVIIQPQLEDKARRKLRRLAQRLLNIYHELDHLTPK
jgi:hypothetical protein